MVLVAKCGEVILLVRLGPALPDDGLLDVVVVRANSSPNVRAYGSAGGPQALGDAGYVGYASGR